MTEACLHSSWPCWTPGSPACCHTSTEQRSHHLHHRHNAAGAAWPAQGGKLYVMPAVRDEHKLQATFQLPCLNKLYGCGSACCCGAPLALTMLSQGARLRTACQAALSPAAGMSCACSPPTLTTTTTHPLPQPHTHTTLSGAGKRRRSICRTWWGMRARAPCSRRLRLAAGPRSCARACPTSPPPPGSLTSPSHSRRLAWLRGWVGGEAAGWCRAVGRQLNGVETKQGSSLVVDGGTIGCGMPALAPVPVFDGRLACRAARARRLRAGLCAPAFRVLEYAAPSGAAAVGVRGDGGDCGHEVQVGRAMLCG